MHYSLESILLLLYLNLIAFTNWVGVSEISIRRFICVK